MNDRIGMMLFEQPRDLMPFAQVGDGGGQASVAGRDLCKRRADHEVGSDHRVATGQQRAHDFGAEPSAGAGHKNFFHGVSA